MSAHRSTEVRVQTERIQVTTQGPTDMVDLTAAVEEIVKKSDWDEGAATIFVVGSTAGITTIEFEPGLKVDMAEVWQKLVPQGPPYHHHQTWGDHNGFSHVRAALQGPSLVVPFYEGDLLLGQWQQIVLLEFDDRPRKRTVVVQLMGA